MLIPHWAKVGAKVVCINNDGWSASYEDRSDVKGPSYNEVVTISGIGSDEYDVIIYTEEYGLEDYPLDDFRPFITIEDDMKLFEHLKNPSLVDKLDLLAERMDLLYKE